MENEKKKKLYIFGVFLVAGRNEKKKLYMKKKSAEQNWATAQFSCEKKKFVLQHCNCIAREWAGKKIVLQLYCKRRV